MAGSGPRISARTLSDPFGVAADDAGNLFVSDGAGGRVFRVSSQGDVTLVADGLEMPSALAWVRDGTLVVANTGAHTIVRVNVQTNLVSIIAGTPGMSGDTDGMGTEAQFNGPIGVTAGADGTIFVADTYNDRIRSITTDGRVRTLAGGREPGYVDAIGADARFNTPCGIIVGPDGSLIIADTGNHRIRRLTPDYAVQTLAGTGEALERDGPPLEAAFDEPTALAVRDAHSLYVADSAGHSVRICSFGDSPAVRTLAGGFPSGLVDSALAGARLNRPTGLALAQNGALIFADSGNGVLRAFVPSGGEFGFQSKSDTAILTASEIRAAFQPRWPFDPPESPREIAGTFGEVRGMQRPDEDSWFHNGLDIPGSYGETVLAILSERVSQPLAVKAAGTPRERVRLPLMGYIHIRVGRDRHDQPLGNISSDGSFSFQRDAEGHVTGVRLRRGTRIDAGAPIGTLNRLNHVHLIAGPTSSEVNALAALELPGLIDTVSPVIERVTITTADGQPLAKHKGSRRARQSIPADARLRMIVRGYDQVDGNARHRRLGIYRLAYTVLNADGSPAPGYNEPRENIVFERLPSDPGAPAVAYAEGSHSGYQPTTVFAYLVTNVVRDGEAREGFWDTGSLTPGEYVLRVTAADFFGNESQRDVPIIVVKD